MRLPLAGRGGILQLEDLALFAWLAVGEPLRERLPAPLILFAAAAGTIACLVTRGPGAPAPLAVNRLDTYASFPTIALVGIFLAEGMERMGLAAPEGLFFGAMVVLAIPLAFHSRLPTLPTAARRVLMTPAILIGSAAFTTLAAELLPSRVDLAVLRHPDDPLFGIAVFITALLLCGAAAFYNLFVICPRVVAGAGGGILWWAVRFTVFVAALALGVTLPA